MIARDPNHDLAWHEEEPLPPSAEIGQLLRQGRFCDAAKLYASWSGTNLIDSKLVIDRLARKHDLAPRNGCASYLMFLAIGVGGAVWYCVA